MNPEPQFFSENSPQHDPILKADGVTAAEKYLARLCEKNFLSLWSYPGIYRDQGKVGESGHGKEICDLLVVFGQHIIIFSDKHCVFPDSGDIERNWKRWFKKAIQKSAEQAWGAERWIRQYPDRVFLDHECKCPLPIDLPPIDRAKFHLVVVAHGISSRIKMNFPASRGSLILDSSINYFEEHTSPFLVGDVAPQKTFVHILDDDSLHTLMSARDTISDFVAYLSARERLFRGSHKIRASGEEQLLAIYLKNLNESNEHDFMFPIKQGEQTGMIFVPEGHWEDFQKAPERIAQLNADKISYLWDYLIERFSFYAMQGNQYFATGGIKDTEKILYFMAREPRWKRRYLARSIAEILRTTPADKRRLRVLPPVDEGDPYYLFLLFPTRHGKTEDEYRTARRNMLESCCAVARLEYPDAKDIIGIAMEPGTENDSRSEDAAYFDTRNWSVEMENHARELQIKLGILKQPRSIKQHMQEYPDVPLPGVKMKNPRNKPCPCGSGKKYKHCCLN